VGPPYVGWLGRYKNHIWWNILIICSLFGEFIVPLLPDLVQELQQRLEGQAPAPSSAAVADASSSERINVTLPRGVMDELKRHALEEGRSCGNLAAYLVEEALRRHRPLH
jgi:hypothetical protein